MTSWERQQVYYQGVGYRNYITQKAINEQKLLELWNKENNSNLKKPFNICRKYGFDTLRKFVDKHKLCGNDFSFGKENEELCTQKEEYKFARENNPEMMKFVSKLKSTGVSNDMVIKAFKYTFVIYGINKDGLTLAGQLQNFLGVFKRERETEIIEYLLDSGINSGIKEKIINKFKK